MNISTVNTNHIFIKRKVGFMTVDNNESTNEFFDKCDNDTVEFTFNTALTLHNKLYIKPFGARRMYYENKNLLDLELIFLKKQNGLNYYKIIATKNKTAINKSKNGKFLYGDRYGIFLEAWSPMYVSRLNCKTIRSLLPNDYGAIYFNNIKHNKKYYKFGIVVPFYSRSKYVEQFLNSLQKTDLNDALLIFIDESMTQNVDEDHKKVNELVKNYQLNYTLIKVYKNRHGNMFDSILYGMDLLYSYCDFLCTIDSDTIHKSNWIQSIYKSYMDCKRDYLDANIVASGFNMVNTRHGVIEKRENYILKNSVGGCNMFFSKEIYIPIIRKCLFSHKWDTNIINSVKEHNWKIITTNPSVIQHIGFETSINGRTKSGQYDYANDFD